MAKARGPVMMGGSSDPEGPVIHIERRETVAIIAPSSDGTHTMLEAAFLAAGTYIGEEARTDRGIELSWEYGGGTFRASHEPHDVRPPEGMRYDPAEDD